MNDHPALIQHLHSLRDTDDRGALAGLRRGLGKPPGTAVETYPHVVPYIPASDAEPARAWPYFLVASLFAEHPRSDRGQNVGLAFRRLKESPSREARFRALLNADVPELPGHLRQAIRQLAQAEIGIDWALLLNDLRYWAEPQRRVQQRWARAYWAEAHPETP